MEIYVILYITYKEKVRNMLADITEYLDDKIEKNGNRLIFTFYELRIKMDLTEPTVEKF